MARNITENSSKESFWFLNIPEVFWIESNLFWTYNVLHNFNVQPPEDHGFCTLYSIAYMFSAFWVGLNWDNLSSKNLYNCPSSKGVGLLPKEQSSFSLPFYQLFSVFSSWPYRYQGKNRLLLAVAQPMCLPEGFWNQGKQSMAAVGQQVCPLLLYIQRYNVPLSWHVSSLKWLWLIWRS